MMEELSKNLVIAVQVVYVYASQQHAKLRTNDRGVDKRLRQEVDDCSTGVYASQQHAKLPAVVQRTAVEREAQAYHQQHSTLPAVVQMTRYILAHARDTVYVNSLVRAQNVSV